MNYPEAITKCYVKVGRFESFENAGSDTKLTPVSCTVFTVEDSMESITESWTFLAQAVKGGAGVAIDISHLRAKGIVGRGGMVSLGPVNFLSVYSEIVHKVRQGRAGAKKGAGLVFINASHPDLVEFISYPREETKHISRAVYLTQEDMGDEIKVQAILTALSKGDIFLAKVRHNSRGERLYTNLCTEVFIKNQGTCILGQINLGMVEDYQDLPDIFKHAFNQLDAGRTSALESIRRIGVYADPEDDKQIGLGVIGLANFLARLGLTYLGFVEALEKVVAGSDSIEKPEDALAHYLYRAYGQVGAIAKGLRYERVFAIAPTASVSYRNFDIEGYTTAPEISPPVCNYQTKLVRRTNENDYMVRQYPPNVEVADKDVPWQVYDRLVTAWQQMQNQDGLGHSISHNWWMTKPCTKENLQEFMDSERLTSYYTWPVEVDVADKTNVLLEGASKDESFWSEEVRTADNDPNYCSACAS